MRRATGFLSAVILLASIIVPGFVNAQGTASFSLTPSSGSFLVGSIISTTIRVTSSDPINAVQADVNYNSSQLQFQNITTSGTAFGLEAYQGANSNTVTVARAVSGGGTVTGTNILATINFKVLGSSGNTSLSFASSSAIVRSTDNQNIWNTSPTGGSYTMTAPPSDPPPSDPPPSDPTPTNPTPTNPTPTNSTPTSPTTTQNNIADDEPVPIVTVASEDDQTYIIAVQVLDVNGDPIQNTEVTLDNEEAITTDATGTASFVNVSPGEHTVQAVGITQTILVETGDKSQVQTFVIAQEEESDNLILYGAIGLGGLLALVLIAFGIGRLRGMTGGSGGSTAGVSGQPYIGGKTPPPAQPTVTPATTAPMPAEPQVTAPQPQATSQGEPLVIHPTNPENNS